jgi:hypothetical protein
MIFQTMEKQLILCKFQLLKSGNVEAYIQDQLKDEDFIEHDPTETIPCDLCNKQINKYFEVSGSHRGTRRALHRICSWTCFCENLLIRKQIDWEKLVENDALATTLRSGSRNN